MSTKLLKNKEIINIVLVLKSSNQLYNIKGKFYLLNNLNFTYKRNNLILIKNNSILLIIYC